MVTVVIALAVGGAVLALTSNDEEGASTRTTRTTTTTTSTSEATEPTTSTTTVTTTVVAEPSPTPVPGVPELTVGPGGGSGETMTTWRAVAGASGYRVLRSDGRATTFSQIADIDVTTGSATTTTGVVNVYSAAHSYLPDHGALPAPDGSSEFALVELGAASERCYRVLAYSAAGAGEPSGIGCATPP